MLALQTVNIGMMEDRGIPQLDLWEGTEAPTERRLWIAIVLRAIFEYEEWLRRIDGIWRSTSRAVSSDYRFEVEKLRRECSAGWFRQICDYAGVEPDFVIRRLNELDKEYGLDKIHFTEKPPLHISRWALRKQKRYIHKNNKLHRE